VVWSRFVEDTIYSLYRRYDIQGLTKQQEKLKKICMNELNSHEEIKNNIKDQNQLEFFILQMALENI
jgi:hypothetical protein